MPNLGKGKDELVLAAMGIDLREDMPEGDKYQVLAKGSPIRAIVKELVDTEDDCMVCAT